MQNDDGRFWAFSLDVYGRPGVAPACLALQDRHGLDVNLLLFCCWAASQGVTLDQRTLAAAEEAARIARIGYAEGKFPQLELIEAERSLAETRESSVDALAALHTARARLARLQGSNSPIYKD